VITKRFAYLDNLRVLLVLGVIAVHAAITYGLDGSWYLESYDEMAGVAVAAVTAVLGVGWLFGLGLFFLIAGRLSAASLERKGPGRFARERLVRLGIPLLGYTLLVSPLLEYVDYRFNAHGEEALWPFVGRQVWHFAPGPTWFLEALLVFSLAYALLRRLSRQPDVHAREPLRAGEVAAVAVALARSHSPCASLSRSARSSSTCSYRSFPSTRSCSRSAPLWDAAAGSRRSRRAWRGAAPPPAPWLPSRCRCS
jgi:peptidoglycan/LPS O-acetylase OafA/YrhL